MFISSRYKELNISRSITIKYKVTTWSDVNGKMIKFFEHHFVFFIWDLLLIPVASDEQKNKTKSFKG